MSAFQVSKAHIDVLVFANSFEARFGKSIDLSDDALGRMLTLENARSINAKYGEEIPAARYRYTMPARTPSVVAMLKAIDCYEYQACEHDGWDDSAAHEFCTRLRKALVHKLPGYDAAPWGIEASDFGQSNARRVI